MELQIPILLGAIAIVMVTFSSRRLGAPAPLLLVLVGVLVSFLPWVGEVKVEPELANGSAFDAAVHQRVCQDARDVSQLLTGPSVSYEQYPELRIRILHAQRRLLLDLRDEGIYSAGALDDALAILDSDEIALSVRESAFEQRGE